MSPRGPPRVKNQVIDEMCQNKLVIKKFLVDYLNIVLKAYE